MIPDPPPNIPLNSWRMVHLRTQCYDGSLILWWLGQSGFAVRYRDEMALIDPYLSDSLTSKYAGTDTPHRRIKPIFIDPAMLAESLVTVVSASHQHTDHLDAETLRPIMRRLNTRKHSLPLIAPKAWQKLAAERAGVAPRDIVALDAGQSAEMRSFKFTAVPAAHDLLERDESGYCKYLGYVIQFGERVVYHSGDTVVYEGMADLLRPYRVELAILPINGKIGNMNGRDAANLAKEIGAKIVIPCHYDMFEFNTADPDELFVPECERIGQAYRVLKLGEGFSFP